MSAGAGPTAGGRLADAARRFLSAITAPGPVLVACSGGGDSTALLLALSEARPTFPALSLHAVTVDHALRTGSAEEAERAGAFARSLGVSHVTLRWQHDGEVAALQASARAARYRLLAEEAQRLGASLVVTGHNADDQAETIAMRRARGEGEGLSGMAPAVLISGSVWVLRPFLHLRRQEIRDALGQRGIGWIDDPSNANLRFERIRVRQSKPGADDAATCDRTEAARRQAAWLSTHARVFAGSVAAVAPPGLAGLEDPDHALALFKLAAAMGGKLHLPPLAARRRALAVLAGGMPGRLTLGGTVFDQRLPGLYLYRENRNLAGARLQPGETVFWDGRYGVCNRGASPSDISAAGDDRHAVERLTAAGVPPAIARRAAPAMPLLQPQEEKPAVSMTRQIAAHAAFLSWFEHPLAECFASLFGLPPVPPVPVMRDFLQQGPAIRPPDR